MRHYDVYRGGVLLGRVVFDNREPGGLWEPAPAYESVREMFERDEAVTELLSNAETVEERDECFRQLELIEAEIMAPGIAFYMADGTKAFDLLALNIYDGRACWR